MFSGVSQLLKLVASAFTFLVVVAACNSGTSVSGTYQSLEILTPEPSSTITVHLDVDELIEQLSSQAAEVRIDAAHKLSSMGVDAEPAVPALIENLHYRAVYDVREAAAQALGTIGPLAKPAVPDLIDLMRTDFVHVRRAAAEALGQIRDKSAVPALAEALYDEDIFVSIEAAESLLILRGEELPNASSRQYWLDENGVAGIVKLARDWWIEEGTLQDWPPLVPRQ